MKINIPEQIIIRNEWEKKKEKASIIDNHELREIQQQLLRL